MSSSPLYSAHNSALTLLYSEVERVASTREVVFTGTAGSIVRRTNAAGFAFYAHQSYDGDGKKRERYLGGPQGDAAVESAVADLRERIDELKASVPSLRMLVREGFAAVDRKTYATLASLHNHGVFRAGGLLVGSHAFGALLNKLGVRAAPFVTEDNDIARAGKLAFSKLPELSLLQMLQESGVAFVEVPALDRKAPPTSFKERGRSQFTVDLLVPAAGDEIGRVAVPELRAHATALPYLDYLLAESQPGVVLAREGCCAVRLPLPERFAVHKLIVSQLRRGREAKSLKDLQQAAILCAALAEIFPGAVADAISAAPASAEKLWRAGSAAIEGLLAERYPRAWDELCS